MCHDTHVEVRGQLERVSSRLPARRWILGSDSGPQDYQPLAAELSCWPRFRFFLSLSVSVPTSTQGLRTDAGGSKSH